MSMVQGLRDEDIAFYHDNGYVVPRYRLPSDLLADMRAAVEARIAEAEAGGQRPEFLRNMHAAPAAQGGPDFLRYAANPAILDMVQALIGPGIILWISRILSKKPITGLEVPWHQDGHYWPIRPLATCSVWIAIDASTRENGCIRYIAGSHKQGLLRHEHAERGDLTLSDELSKDAYDEGAAVDIELEPGQMVLHDVFTVHGSNANTSPKRRAALILRYMPSSSLYDRTLKEVNAVAGYDICALAWRRLRPNIIV
jgi:ectoine hydroxylase-related dioxygenase (phytanoyl-CoA dioxygenase family)